MRLNQRILLAACLLGLAAARAEENPAPAVPAAPAAGEPAARTYDALFSEILQNLPEGSRAKVDSARTRAAESRPVAPPPATGTTPMPSAAGERALALEKLPPEVKERVEKAIRNLENRNLDRMLEFKEPEK